MTTPTPDGPPSPDTTPPSRSDTGVSERQEYLDGGLTGISCEVCGYVVRAGRRSVMQTSVQWAGTACEQLFVLAGGRPTALVPTCPALRESLDRAVREGRLEIR